MQPAMMMGLLRVFNSSSFLKNDFSVGPFTTHELIIITSAFFEL